MKNRKIKTLLYLFLSFVALLSFVACPTSDEPTRSLKMQIDKDNDSLLTFDSLIIKVYSKDSSYSQEVFHGVLRDPKQVSHLPLDPRVGKEYTVSIIGYKDGKVGVNQLVTVLGPGNFQSKDLIVQVVKPPDTVVVIPPNPDILAPSDTSVVEGDSLRFRVSVRNPGTGASSLTLKEAIPGAALDTAGRDPGDGYFTWRPSFDQGRTETYAVTFVYTTGNKKIERISRVKVLNLNRSPRLTTIADQKTKESETLSFKIDASDPDRDSLTMTATGLPDGATFVGGTFTWKPSVGQAGNFSVKFTAFDGHDSDLVAVLITVGNVDVPPPLTVKITSPARDTTVNITPITILYTVNGTSLQRQVGLKDGKTKIFIDTTIENRTGLDTITITFDTIPPSKPMVNGNSPVLTRTPAWTWKSGGGGIGIYRFRLDNEEMALATIVNDTLFTPSKALILGTHTLFVQERDSAGNWSESGKRSIRIDTTQPSPPKVSVSPQSPTNNTQPTWSWDGGEGDGTGVYRYKIDDPDLRSGATETRETKFTPAKAKALNEGVHTLYVQQVDSEGNWSNSGSAQVRIDTTAPTTPIFGAGPATPTNVLKPEWKWVSGGNGGIGHFRYRLDSSDLSGAVEITSTTFTPEHNLNEGIHVLYVQERDSAGNWSQSAAKKIRIDLTPPNAPKVSAAVLHTTNLKPQWNLASGGNGGNGIFRFKLDDPLLLNGSTSEKITTYTPPGNLTVGSHTLYVQEQDSAGNWSSTSFYSIKVHGQIGYAVGYDGVLLKTTNGGANWTQLPNIYNNDLVKAYFINTNLGFAVGSKGTILKTTDGGLSWDPRPSQTAADLHAVYFINSNEGFAMGYDGTIVRTSNGGTSWLPIPSGTTENLFSLQMIDSETGYASGANGTLLKTTSGGAYWDKLTSGTTETLLSICFTDANTGYAAGGGGTILKTTNGGASWSALPSGTTTQFFNSVFFTSEKTGYAVGGLNTLVKTTDGGASWKSTNTGYDEYFGFVYFIDDNTGFVAGGGSDLIKTVDGGVTWSRNLTGSPSAIYSVFFP